MRPQVFSVAARLSLRPPQRTSLERLDQIADLIPLKKGTDPAAAQQSIQTRFPGLEFERNFPSFCFALATGVGKTRLMGAFIAYLYSAHRIRHFFVLAPGLTIYNKLIHDFTPNTSKYVFQGIGEFTTNRPEIITQDNYEDGRGVRNDIRVNPTLPGIDTSPIHINIFNIAKINAELKGGRTSRVKSFQELIGQSYFDYLSKLPDLVMIMDEAHRYRGTQGAKAINDLNPILGLELTATPQIEKGGKTERFKNIVYSYPLSAALKDEFVKQPAVATRTNFQAEDYDEAALERIKLEDGIRIHEDTKGQIEVYRLQNEKKRVKPFMLVIARDTGHAESLKRQIEEELFDGNYRGKVILVHSSLSGEEKEDNVEKLLKVEDTDNPTEIVIHVNMLKEGWDVTNLYTIVPLRAANARTLVEQSIGRGLRLPYGERTGNPAVDRLTIVAHDKFQEIVDESNRPESLLQGTPFEVVLVPEKPTQVVTVQPTFVTMVTGKAPISTVAASQPQQKPLIAPIVLTEEQKAADLSLDAFRQFESSRRIEDIQKPETLQKVAAIVEAKMRPTQGQFPEVTKPVDYVAVAKKVADAVVEKTIAIPRIRVVPDGEHSAGFEDFDLDTSTINYQSDAQDILIQNLADEHRYLLTMTSCTIHEKRLEDYIVRGLMFTKNDIDYDSHAELLYKLAGQAVKKLQSYLPSESAVRDVLLRFQRPLCDLVHAQMQGHFREKAERWVVRPSKGFQVPRGNTFGSVQGEDFRPFRTPIDNKNAIRNMIFTGFNKCVYPAQKFQSDPERRFAAILEDDPSVLKWFKPGPDDLPIDYELTRNYEPDFVAETIDRKYICEIKSTGQTSDEVVAKKARAASTWCANASTVDVKPWSYLLIPHDAVLGNMSLSGLAARYTQIASAS